eukprot:TRINITY_DN26247_c0_g1_i1.p1 TRINITY_DN26247_c0_g1~~TRINITY_DN26247_c0_g1_i1.p1  ORF type:complete len:392 (+),score=35.18 TRINITY_DN26247_c0_g1_i1:72-1247(+)
MEELKSLRWISRCTICASVFAIVFVGVVYNAVFLCQVLPSLGHGMLAPVLGIVFNTLLLLATWSYLRAHCGDPGRMPGRWFEFVESMGPAILVAPSRPEWQPGKATHCDKCNVARPERAHHCKICKACILRMDHHCPWVGNCIGHKNHKFFLLLTIYACAGSVFSFVSVFPVLVKFTWDPLSRIRLRQPTGIQSTSPPPSLSELATTPQLTFRLLSEGDAEFADGTFRNLAMTSLTEEEVVASTPSTPDPEKWYVVLALFAMAFVSAATASLLASLLYTHLPLAFLNLTTIEENYENMPNPFNQGTKLKNLAQIFGMFGPDWFVPVTPRRPLSDGVSYMRMSEFPPPAGSGFDALEPEDLWKLRYATVIPSEPEPVNDGMMAPLTWMFGTG